MFRCLDLLTGGESHGPGLTAILVGMPAGLPVDRELLAHELARRQHGYGRGRRMQIESDRAEIRGGVRDGETLGSPISLWIENRDWENWETIMAPFDADPHMAEVRRIQSPRPGHVDLAGSLKYDRRDPRDVLERASARETAARVACAAFAHMLLAEFDIAVRSGVRTLGPIGVDRAVPTWEELEAVDDGSPLRAVHRDLEDDMVALVDATKERQDTLGGSFTVIAHGVPPGLGSHVQFDRKLDGRLAAAVTSVQAIKAVEFGAAIAASRGPGSEAHDAIERIDGEWHRPTNRAGGLEGGITNGADVVVTGYDKPISTLAQGMPSVDLDTLEPATSQYERSDVTALPACAVVAEAMVALVIADALIEKLGGDSIEEMQRHWEATRELQRRWPKKD